MGWKDILRPIRDGLRDNLPSKPPRRDPEKDIRCGQDALKGFTYFDSFQDVDNWRPDQAYSFQRANTPLLLRSCPNTVDGRARVTLIHDFSGNYHDYEDVHWPGVDRPSYSCDYLQAIDTFIYFSHKVCNQDYQSVLSGSDTPSLCVYRLPLGQIRCIVMGSSHSVHCL
ncbi:hypothetical protein AUEXF2481DRAFT_43833 [Aureobasidium subglaciale EXF-2481]|uniref:Uncharacterized protein n=1 Tax=Aureobasidium subglaciale (strain EXF-2481) TaxID=1043005 RepID=A0A074Y1K4_AURSE|nr:uncharacterized protein AUEXF2481DRAFT_43833 [Aureobasidium subglaciale EXF-2481]KEQ91658.1 hypothetical protein AUEXF2481DRAFT_43833 [Aureobasidium subglaciale EXF-2481]